MNNTKGSDVSFGVFMCYDNCECRFDNHNKWMNKIEDSYTMNKKQARLTNLEEILRERKLVSIKDMAHLLDVSEMTVRRDIRQLEMASRVKNLNGMLISSADNSFSMLSKQYELHS